MSGFRNQRVTVLLVEDNEGDVGLFREGLTAAGATLNLHVAIDGLQAMDFLRRSRPLPDLVVLDLNIPGKSGYEILREIKEDPEVRTVPVVIFTSSSANRDVKMAYQLQANSFVRKPTDVDEFFQAVADMERFWMRTAVLPGGA